MTRPTIYKLDGIYVSAHTFAERENISVRKARRMIASMIKSGKITEIVKR